MKIGEYKQMMKFMTRPGTPEQNKKAEENNKKYLADRRAKTLKEYGLDKPLVVNNGNIQTETQFVKELPIEEQPGYDYQKDPNLLRRMAVLQPDLATPEFKKAIAEEDKALKKLGRDPLTILQRNTIKKFDNNDPSTYPSNPEQRRKLLAQKKLEDNKPFTKIANNLGKKELKPFKKIPKKTTPIDIPLPDINYNLYMQSKEQLFKPDPYLDELKKKVDLAQEQSYQEKVKNNTSGLRSFAPLEVKRDYNE